MSGKCRKIMYALVVTVFAAFLWMICCENDRKVSDKAIGETTVQSMRSGEKTVSLEQSDIPKIEIEDLTDAFTVILQYAPKDMLAGCTVDEAFLMWFYAQYGRDAVIHIAFDVLDGGNEPDVWYEETGNSIYVLWLLYCRDSGFGQHELENVYWMQTAAASEMVFGFAGDINFAENWYTTEYMKEQPDGLQDCFSEDLLAQMQGVDVMIMNNEFTYANKKGATSVYGKAYTFRADPQKAELLEIFGTDTVTLANNHVYDYGKRGFLSTLDVLDQEGIPYSGAGRNLKDASKIIYYVMNGRKVAFVSATQIERSKQYTKAATETEPGVLKALHPEKFLKIVEEAAQNSDYVIAEVHWGTEGMLYPDQSQRHLAEQIAQAGADVIIGGHPHRLQGVAFVGDVPIAYSLGNFWFSTGTLYTTLSKVTITEDGTVKLSFIPCIQQNLTTRILTEPEERSDFYEYLASISADIGIDVDGVVYHKNADDYPAGEILYDSDTSRTDIIGMADNEGDAIDIVGNLREDR